MTSLTDDARTIGLSGHTGQELVVVEQAGSRATVTLNDPVTLNALNPPLSASLHRTLRQLVHAPELRTIVLTGAGGAFSSGAVRGDAVLAGSNGSVDASTSALRWELAEIARLIASSDIPFVAAVNGVVGGASLALALACDVVVVSDRAALAPGAGRVGLLSEVGMSWLLSRRMGYERTLSLFTKGYHLSASEAALAGLVEAAVEHDQLAAAVSFWCELAGLAATRSMTRPLVRSATDSGLGRAALMGQFLTPVLAEGQDFNAAPRDRRKLSTGEDGPEDVDGVITDVADPDPSGEVSTQSPVNRSEVLRHRSNRRARCGLACSA